MSEFRGYAVELSWGWGREMRFNEIERFHVISLEEIDAHVKAFIPRMVDRYSFDCGRLEHPLNPWLYGLRITPIGETEYRDTTQWDALVEEGVVAKRAALAAGKGEQ